MSQSYCCKAKFCNIQYIETLGQAIDHLRGYHFLRYIDRPSKLGTPDFYGNLWYCRPCYKLKISKDHRSFKSDRAMWDHLNTCHEFDVEDIRPCVCRP